MPAGHKVEKTAAQAALGHGLLAVLALALIAGAMAVLVAVVGDPEDAGPRMELSLFENEGDTPPELKSRLDPDAPGPAQEPSLGVEYEEIDLGEGRPDTPPEIFTITELAAPAAPAAPPPAPAPRTPLPVAPVAAVTERTAAGDLPRIASDGRTPALVYSRPFTPQPGAAKVALIVGGLGLRAETAEQAINTLPAEVTLSFVPYSDNLQSWINKARAAGHEVLLEIPMEPFDYPNVDTGPQTLLTTVSAQENSQRLTALLARATGYFGLTNYQGAKFVTDAKAGATLFAALSQRGLAFVHDGAAARSTLPSLAASSRAPFRVADRIVDNEPTAEGISAALSQLEAAALQKGGALGVGYAYPITIEQFREWSRQLPDKGLQLVPASHLLGVAPASGGKP